MIVEIGNNLVHIEMTCRGGEGVEVEVGVVKDIPDTEMIEGIIENDQES